MSLKEFIMTVLCYSRLFSVLAVFVAMVFLPVSVLAQDNQTQIMPMEVNEVTGEPVKEIFVDSVEGTVPMPAEAEGKAVMPVDAFKSFDKKPEEDNSFSVPDVGELHTTNSMEEEFEAIIEESANSISAPSVMEADEEEFFDADELIPQGEMAAEGPVNVTPSTHPASKYLIVNRKVKADTKSAQLVSAERAIALGRYDSALLIFDNLYKTNKRDPRVLMGRAVVLQKLSRFDEAMGMYEELEAVDPDNIDVKVNMLGLLGTRFPAIALRRLMDLHVKHPSHVALTAQIAVIAAKAGDTEAAVKYLGMAASMEPQNASHLFNLAIIMERLGDKKQAISYYEKALEVDTIYGAGRSVPRDTIYERLAEIR